MLKSWKTTLCGIVATAAGMAAQCFPETTAGKIAGIVAYVAGGLGLLLARDNGVTSEQAGAK